MRPRRLAVVTRQFPLPLPTPPGEDYFAEPARLMAGAGWEVEMLSGQRAWRALLSRRYDVVHGHSHFPPALLAGLIARGARTVFTSHSYELPRAAWKRRVCVALMNRFDRVIALTPFERDVYRAAGVDASKIVVLPLPINVSFFRTTAAPAEPPVILFVANLRPVKNPEVIVRAFRRVQAELPAARLVIAGANLMGAPIETVGWLGPEQLREAFARASVVVNSSSHESFGLSIFEAMAAGRPVCLPDLGSLRSRIGDNALYHAPTDDAALAANILRYLREPSLRRAHVEANRQLVAAFDTPRVLEQYRALYESVLKG